MLVTLKAPQLQHLPEIVQKRILLLYEASNQNIVLYTCLEIHVIGSKPKFCIHYTKCPVESMYLLPVSNYGVKVRFSVILRLG